VAYLFRREAILFDDPRLNLKKELLPGESLLWAGRPRQGFYLQAQDAWMVPFSLVWCGITITLLSSALRSGETSPGVIFFLIHGFVGLYLLVGRFIYDVKRRAATFYGLTDRGPIILSGFFRKIVKRIQLQSLSDITLTEHRDSWGTIRFDSGDQPEKMNWYGGRKAGYIPPGFERIENARSVFAKIMEVKKGI
jgi:hypothetical protein